MTVPSTNLDRSQSVTLANPTPPTNVAVTYQGTPPTPVGLAPAPTQPLETSGLFADPLNGAIATQWTGTDALPVTAELAGKAEADGTEVTVTIGNITGHSVLGDYTETPNEDHPSSGGVVDPVILLTGTTVSEDAAINTVVGSFSIANSYTGTPVYSLIDSAGGKFNIALASLRTNAALDYETAATHNVTVRVTGITPAAPDKVFTVLVLDVTETGGTGTWNPADKEASLTLSPDMLTVIGGGTNNFASVRATVSKATGKRFCKFTLVETTGWDFNGGLFVGFMPASSSLDHPNYPGAAGGIGYNNIGICFCFNGTQISTTLPVWTTASVIDMATNLDLKKVWFNVDGAGYNGDPVAGTGGLDITTAIDGTTPMFPAAMIRSSGAGVGEILIDLSGTGAPSGFLPWGSGTTGLTKNIVTDYGAVADGEWADTTSNITAGTNVLTVASAIFEAGDVGKSIVVPTLPFGSSFHTTIVAIGGGGTQATLGGNCPYTLDDFPGIVAWGTNNEAMFQACKTENFGKSLTLTIPPGTYLVSSGNFEGLWDGIRNITVNAAGATLCGDAWQIQATAQYGSAGHTARIASVSAGATFATLLNGSDLSRFTVGNYALATGFDMQSGSGYPTNHAIHEYLRIAAIDSDVGSPTYRRITFLTPLKYSYLSTWPTYYAGGLDWGGPATLYAMHPNFNHTSVVNGLRIAQQNQYGTSGLNLTFNDCIFEGSGQIGPHMTMAQYVKFNNCTALGQNVEVDKLCELVESVGCSWEGLYVQSSSINELILDNTDVQFSVMAPRKLVIRNGCNIGKLVSGPVTYGFNDELEVRDSVISQFGSDTYHEGGFEVRSGDGSGDGIQTDFSIEDGIIRIPASMRLLGTGQWAITGGRMHLWDPNVGSLRLFTITDVWEASPGGDILVATNMTLDDWPSRSYSPALGLWLKSHNTPVCTFVNVTGCPEVIDLSGHPAGTPLYSRYKRTHGSGGNGPYWPLFGRVKYIKIDVTTPYVGATTPATAQLDMGNALISNAGADVVWEPVIDLKTMGARTFDATAGSYPVNWASTATGASDTLPNMTAPLWQASNFRVLQGALAAGTGPVFSVEVICDQGL